MTAGIRSTIRTMTGDEAMSCPWRAFQDPFVHRVLDGVSLGGELAFALPDPSHRLVEGIKYYRRVDNRVAGRFMDLERAERERKAKA